MSMINSASGAFDALTEGATVGDHLHRDGLLSRALILSAEDSLMENEDVMKVASMVKVGVIMVLEDGWF